MKRQFLIIVFSGLVYVCFSMSLFAETVVLKSGRKVEGEIVQKTNEKIKVDIGRGMLRTYELDEIKSIAGRGAAVYRPKVNIQKEKEEEASLQQEREALNKGIAYLNHQMYAAAIREFNKAIAIKPNDPEVYCNRARAYYLRQEYDKAWEDVHRAEALGYTIEPGFLEELKKASGSEK